MRRMLSESEHFTVNQLYTRLARQVKHDEKIQETPVRISLSGREESIILRPMRISESAEDLLDDRTLALLSITVSLSQKPDRPALRLLQQWLKAAAPRTISAVSVDRVMLQTECIQDFLNQRGRPALQKTIAKDLQGRRLTETLILHPSSIEAADPHQSRGSQSVRAQVIIESLEGWNDRVYQSMQSNLLLDQDFCSDKELETLQSNEPAKALGLSDLARLSLLSSKMKASSSDADGRALSRASIRLDPTTSMTASLCYGRMFDENVIIQSNITSQTTCLSPERSL